MAVYNVGDRIVMTDKATDHYYFTKVGAKGTLVSALGNNLYDVRFICATLSNYNELPDTEHVVLTVGSDYFTKDTSMDLSKVRSSKIDAIKALREITGMGLRDAKNFVDAIGANYSRDDRDTSSRIINLQNEIDRLNARIADDAATIREMYNDRESARDEIHNLRAKIEALISVLTPEQLRNLLIKSL